MAVKVCCRCGQPKPATPEFFYWRKKNDLPHSWCKVCYRAWSKTNYAKNPDLRRKQQKEWVEKNRGRLAQLHRRRQLFRMYGLTEDDYDRLYKEQNGLCKICKGVPKGRMPVDHNHKTGEVRGLLCDACNLGLGCFRDDPDRMIAAVAYVRISSRVTREAEKGVLVPFPRTA